MKLKKLFKGRSLKPLYHKTEPGFFTKQLALKTLRTFFTAVAGGFFLLAILTALSFFPNPTGIKSFVVMSGSMHPAVPLGSLVITRPQPVYKSGDIITFSPSGNSNLKDTITHRVVSAKTFNSGTSFIVKGDANNAPDSREIPQSGILGKVILTVPFLGFVISFTKSFFGLVLVIIIPSTILIYTEILKIKAEALTLLKNRGKIKKLDLTKHSDIFNTFFVLMLVTTFFTGTSLAILEDKEIVSSNQISTGSWTESLRVEKPPEEKSLDSAAETPSEVADKPKDEATSSAETVEKAEPSTDPSPNPSPSDAASSPVPSLAPEESPEVQEENQPGLVPEQPSPQPSPENEGQS